MEKIVRDWTKWIVPRVNNNKMPNEKDGDMSSFRTTDMISIRSDEELEGQNFEQDLDWAEAFVFGREYNERLLTDFAQMNNAEQNTDAVNANIGYYLTRFPYFSRGNYLRRFVDFGLCPSLTLDVSSEAALSEIGTVSEVKLEESHKILYHTIELGEYPKTKVPEILQQELEAMYNGGHLRGGLSCTGKLYTTNGGGFNFISKQNPEFEFNGEHYVRVTVNSRPDSEVGESGDVKWVKVEPIKFRIENYKEFVQGKTKTLELDSDQLILSGIPFFSSRGHANHEMWQNSMIRAFMNSTKTSEMDGNPEYRGSREFDFRNSGFLYQALNMTRQPTTEYIIPAGEDIICDYAFRGCVGIKKIIIPSHVAEIGSSAFSGCVNTQLFISQTNNIWLSENALEGTDFKFVYIAKDGGSMVFSPREDASLESGYFKSEFELKNAIRYFSFNYRENFVQLKTWKEKGIIKFIPPEFTIQLFPSSQMKNYFVNNNNQRWGRLVKTLGFDTLEGLEKDNSLVDLMKIYYAIGGFSDNQGESEKAFDYVLKYVATTRKLGETPREIGEEVHGRFSNIKLKGAYNPTFAKFFMKYYHQNPDFMKFEFEEIGDEEEYVGEANEIDYLCMAHNAFDTITKCFPNRVVTGNEERALLTPRFVAEHSEMREYDNVDKGNELLARTIGRYGYDQEQFERIQEVYNYTKIIKDQYVISADKAKDKNGITFRVLEKDDPLGFVLGEITNCCQHVGGAGESCVDDGYKNPNAGFLVFEESKLDDKGKSTGENRVLGQAYIWYDPQTKTVCYDNIEIPRNVLKELRQGNKHGEKLSSDLFIDSVIESADAIMLAMNRKGIQVDRVTTGEGYNDLRKELEEKFGAPERDPIAKHRGYNGYSDAESGQYLIRTYDEVTKMYADKILETANTIRTDLNEIKNAENQQGYEI